VSQAAAQVRMGGVGQ